jgi:hypothetical protein
LGPWFLKGEAVTLFLMTQKGARECFLLTRNVSTKRQIL